MGVVRILVIFQDRSTPSFKRSRRELSIDVAGHRSMLKNYENTHYPHFTFMPKTGIALPKTGVLFLLRIDSTFQTVPSSPNLLHLFGNTCF